MWNGLKRSVGAPLRIAGILSRMVVLLEEQNRLLREVHVALTGRSALTPRRSRPDQEAPQGARRVRTANDVSVVRPTTELEQARRERDARGHDASAPSPSITPDDLAHEEINSTLLVSEPSDGPENTLA